MISLKLSVRVRTTAIFDGGGKLRCDHSGG